LFIVNHSGEDELERKIDLEKNKLNVAIINSVIFCFFVFTQKPKTLIEIEIEIPVAKSISAACEYEIPESIPNMAAVDM